MGFPRSPGSRTGLTQEDYNWRRIFAVTGVYILVIITFNLRTAWLSYPSVNKIAQPFFSGGHGADMRPTLFSTQPTAAASQAAARVIDPSLFDGIGNEGLVFRDDMKNPCWNDGTGGLQCLPFFYIMGPFQAGVRDMQVKMYRHPQIVRTANPEPHFWSENRPTDKFLQGMSTAAEALQKHPEHNVIGDWSASYFAGYWAMQARVHQAFYGVKARCWGELCANKKDTAEERAARLTCVQEQCYEPAQREDHKRASEAGVLYEQMQTPLLMHAMYNGVTPRFVVMLRDPVERLHSSFWTYGHYWERYGGKNAEGFLKFVAEQTQGFRNCTDVEGHSTFTCALYLESLSQYLEDIFFHCDQLLRGVYSIWLHLWFSVFPRESFLVLKSEDYFVDPRAVLDRVFAHLGLSEPTETEWAHILDASEIRTAAAGQAMLPEARQMAREFYEPFNKDLAALLGSKAWLWDSSRAPGQE